MLGCGDAVAWWWCSGGEARGNGEGAVRNMVYTDSQVESLNANGFIGKRMRGVALRYARTSCSSWMARAGVPGECG